MSRLPVRRNFDVVASAEYIKQLSRDLIAKKREKMQRNEKTEVDIISVALQSGGFTDEDLVNQMMTFLAAGHETTASAMTWALYALCEHPEIQTRLREEIRANLPSIHDASVDVSALQIDKLAYLNAVCSEIIRCYPFVPLSPKVTEKDTTLLGVKVPKDTALAVPVEALNRDPKLWGPDADQFNPDRWLGGDNALTGGAPNNFAMLSFSAALQ